MTAYVGVPLGQLPVPTRQYYAFQGWCSVPAWTPYPDECYWISSTTVFDTAEDRTVYALWGQSMLLSGQSSSYHVHPGDEFTFTISLRNSTYATNLLRVGLRISSYQPDYDLFEVVSLRAFSDPWGGGEGWTVTWHTVDTSIWQYVWADIQPPEGQVAHLNGRVLEIVFHVRDDTPLGVYDFGTDYQNMQNLEGGLLIVSGGTDSNIIVENESKGDSSNVESKQIGLRLEAFGDRMGLWKQQCSCFSLCLDGSHDKAVSSDNRLVCVSMCRFNQTDGLDHSVVIPVSPCKRTKRLEK